MELRTKNGIAKEGDLIKDKNGSHGYHIWKLKRIYVLEGYGYLRDGEFERRDMTYPLEATIDFIHRTEIVRGEKWN